MIISWGFTHMHKENPEYLLGVPKVIRDKSEIKKELFLDAKVPVQHKFELIDLDSGEFTFFI